jgi:glycosyltransferase involved in cell wall biosynthesis
LNTLLNAIKSFKSEDDLAFIFVGGGRGKVDVEHSIQAEKPSNVLSLPYEPLENLSHSLSAADVHIVVMGDNMVGIVHPCKIYGAMSVAKPVLYVGPERSHLAELITEHKFGWVIGHGEVDRLTTLIREIAEMPPSERTEMGLRGKEALAEQYSSEKLNGRFCDLVETLSAEQR